MKYKPERDIPKAVMVLKTLSPSRIVEWIRDNRTQTDRYGKRRQKNIKPQAITMWFRRHQDVYLRLKRELEERELDAVAISENTFQTLVFIRIQCVEKWILKLRGRQAKEKSIMAFVGALRQVCLGQIPRRKANGEESRLIEGWGIKHPRRLTVEDGLRYVSELQKRGLPTRNFRLALRNFLKSRGLVGWDDISGKLDQSSGMYAHLFISKANIYSILNYIKSLNLVAYRACLFAFKTGCRMGGIQSAHSSRINYADHTIWVTEKATRGKPKREQEKFIPEDLWNELDLDNFKGKLFNINEQTLRDVCTTAYHAMIPEVAEEIPMPFHFWRHQFAQHMLRKTEWNYALVAGLGHWTVETLERYYGKMDRKTRLEGASKFLHQT